MGINRQLYERTLDQPSLVHSLLRKAVQMYQSRVRFRICVHRGRRPLAKATSTPLQRRTEKYSSTVVVTGDSEVMLRDPQPMPFNCYISRPGTIFG